MDKFSKKIQDIYTIKTKMTSYLISLINFYLDLVKNLKAYSISQKITIGKPSVCHINLSYGSSHIIQMPIEVSHRLCVMN